MAATPQEAAHGFISDVEAASTDHSPAAAEAEIDLSPLQRRHRLPLRPHYDAGTHCDADRHPHSYAVTGYHYDVGTYFDGDQRPTPTAEPRRPPVPSAPAPDSAMFLSDLSHTGVYDTRADRQGCRASPSVRSRVGALG